MLQSSIQTIEQFKTVLSQLSLNQYVSPCKVLSNATIGQHTRHIIELYQCLIAGYEEAMVSYDKRQRNKMIEEDIDFAIVQLVQIQETIKKPNKEIQIVYEMGDNEGCLKSNYFREVLYNLEHMIHHHALIKVGIIDMTTIQLPDSFGVAPSTIKYRKACVQ
ncbi:DinB family protein [Croceitalea rosinachiae]|uniref:DinB family protein n=1 Tax=Croceitalea rosinachiae TaxID=3075596 RepID=A0ABU3A5J8_9FLAO|nr:DinB family protein [Croceitalea sp. F388]MDT0605439.1 DinB family protein [Croceitalea sp. F388]